MFRKTVLVLAIASMIASVLPQEVLAKTKHVLSHKELLFKMEEDVRTLRAPGECYIQAGLPNYPGFFGRDSEWISLELIDYDPGIARCALDMLVKFQGTKFDAESEEEPGKILHEWHKSNENYGERNWPYPYYGSADSTPRFIHLSGVYFKKICETACDMAWLEKMWPHIEAALAWCRTSGNIGGDIFIKYERKNPKGLFHQGWKDSDDDHLKLAPPVAIVEIQGYYYEALTGAAEMAMALGKFDRALELLNRAKFLKTEFMKKFWLPNKQWFAFAVDKNGVDERVASNQGHILMSGLLDDEPEKAAALVHRLFEPDMWTPFGIRTNASSNPDFNPRSYHQGSIGPHDNWIIARGLKRLCFQKEYNLVKNAQITAARIFHGRIPELYRVVDGKLQSDPDACVPQGWSSGGLLNFLISKKTRFNLEKTRRNAAGFCFTRTHLKSTASPRS